MSIKVFKYGVGKGEVNVEWKWSEQMGLNEKERTKARKREG